MAVYFDHRLECAGPSGINTDIQWCTGAATLLAVASYSEGTGGTVNIFNEEVALKVINVLFLLFTKLAG